MNALIPSAALTVTALPPTPSSIRVDPRRPTVEVHGTLLNGFRSAGRSIRLLLHRFDDASLEYDPGKWYSLSDFKSLLEQTSCYSDPSAVLERIGEEMMRGWYEQGPGRQLAPGVIDFLRLQSGSQGYSSVVRGAPEDVGTFELENIDEGAGIACVRSSTIFDRHLELGILNGALRESTGLLYFEVALNRDNEHFEIKFITETNLETAYWAPTMSPAEWRLAHQVRQFERRELFWISINNTLNQAFDEMRQKATLDVLTGIYTRGEFLHQFEVRFQRAARDGVPLSMLYMDLDRFKFINDTHGHPVGDRVLQAFCRSCEKAMRIGDSFGRVGGEEFAVVLWDTNLEDARHIAEKVLAQIRSLRVDTREGQLGFTVSIGVAERQAEETPAALTDRADKNMLLAKHSGRNRAVS